MPAVADAVTALQDAMKCVEAAMRALKSARLSGEQSVKQHGILEVLDGNVLRRLRALCVEVEAE